MSEAWSRVTRGVRSAASTPGSSSELVDEVVHLGLEVRQDGRAQPLTVEGVSEQAGPSGGAGPLRQPDPGCLARLAAEVPVLHLVRREVPDRPEKSGARIGVDARLPSIRLGGTGLLDQVAHEAGGTVDRISVGAHQSFMTRSTRASRPPVGVGLLAPAATRDLLAGLPAGRHARLVAAADDREEPVLRSLVSNRPSGRVRSHFFPDGLPDISADHAGSVRGCTSTTTSQCVGRIWGSPMLSYVAPLLSRCAHQITDLGADSRSPGRPKTGWPRSR